MIAAMGFLAGYVMGTRAGKEGLQELLEAWEVIRESDEFKALLAGAQGLASQILGQAAERGANRRDYAEVATALTEIVDYVQRRGGLRPVS